MVNSYEQRKNIKAAAHQDMVVRVSKEARQAFDRQAYPVAPVAHCNIRHMLELKKSINFILSRVSMMDEWEQETIRRIEKRIREGSGTHGQEETKTI